eukprot:TRINITY_DN539_c1_g1_i12.p1 TRINITY_DN539_c1_g1~~TRINITY_DN539_c1_g1_i12.p1  ORF type:complete len:904 (+),score=303.94 TRINITY_DN539_c1_g1_i12:234-2945(+)
MPEQKKSNESKPEEKKKRLTGKEREEELKAIREAREKAKKEEELTEEDLKLKKDLELLVERANDGDVGVQKNALGQLSEAIRSSTSSMTAVPKPLKFLRPHYDGLKQLFDNNKVHEGNKPLLADVISILGMTMGGKDRDCLRYKLKGTGSSVGSWGHEYVRTLAGEIGDEFAEKTQAGEDVAYLFPLVNEIVPFNMKHNSEPEACDLLMEVERLDDIVDACDEENYKRVCLYLGSCAHYLPEPEDTQSLKLVYKIYLKFNQRCDAMRMALRLQDRELAQAVFEQAEDPTEKKQLAFLLARQLMKFDTDDDTLASILNNASLSERYLALGKDLDVLEAKSPDDIYKSHLSETATIGADSARGNLASTFVNAFVNCGYGSDTLMTTEGSKWVYKNKDHGMTSAVASLGMINLWDVDEGLAQLDKYLYVDDVNIKTGAILAIGLVAASIRDDDVDPAFALLVDHLESAGSTEKIGVVIGFALAYAGSAREDILETLLPILSDGETSHELACFTALAIGVVFVGTCNAEAMQEIFTRMSSVSETDAKQTITRQMALGLGLLFLARKEDADVGIELVKTLDDALSKVVLPTIEVCAYTGTGNVLKIQSLLQSLTTVAPEPEEGQDAAAAAAAADLSHLMIPTLGIALVSLGDDLGVEMALRQYDHLLQYGDVSIRRAVPLGLALTSISNPRLTIMDTLNKLTNDTDQIVSQNAIFALGLIGAGTNNARIAATLRHLASYYGREQNHLFVVRLAQGLLHLGKGTLTLNPYHSEREVLSYASVAGLLPVVFAALDIKSSFLGRHHYLLYYIATALYPRMLITLDEDLNMINVNVRVGEAVDTVGQAGKPKTITGFQTHTSPVLLPYGHRAELATEEYLTVCSVLEGFAILKKNPDYVPPESETDVLKKRS